MKRVIFISILFFSLFLLAACGSDDANENENENANGTENNEEEVENNEEEDTDDGNNSTEEENRLLDELKEDGTVKVGFADEKPYGYENDDGELTGASVDTAKAVFKELGIDEVEGHLDDYSKLVPGLGAGKFDAITSGMAITPDRCKEAAFAEPDMKYGEGLIVQKGNPLDLHSYKDIADNPDATVSIMSGATEIDFVQSEGVDEGQIQNAPDIPATIAAVQTGRADATTGTEMTLLDILQSNEDQAEDLEFVEDFEQPDIDGVPSYGAVAFHPDNQELLDAFNEELAKLKEDGTVAQILEDNGFDGERNFPDEGVTAEMVCNGEE